jgi:hypothetical protein
MDAKAEVEIKDAYCTIDGEERMFDLWAIVQTDMRDDTFDHEFGTHTVAPYPDEQYMQVVEYKTTPQYELTDQQVLRIIKSQTIGGIKW